MAGRRPPQRWYFMHRGPVGTWGERGVRGGHEFLPRLLPRIQGRRGLNRPKPSSQSSRHGEAARSGERSLCQRRSAHRRCGIQGGDGAMKVIVQVPIKGHSERVPNKNRREVGGKPLYAHLLDRIAGHLPHDWRLVVDSESDDVLDEVKGRYACLVETHKRIPWYASEQANGNHLLVQFACAYPSADVYVQTFVTAPKLTLESLVAMVGALER